MEIFRRLGEPALILSPTRVIRNQWIRRLRDYCPPGDRFPPAWTSRSLDEPGFLTSITYQALHTKYRDASSSAETDDAVAAEDESTIRTDAIDHEEISSFIMAVKQAGIRTLILDEAHHLRAEWWKALSEVVESIDGMIVVSLTATPPYDSSMGEWRRYEELCGAIDEEISIPELVKAGTLCPHQDFVWTVVPTEWERTYLAEYQRDVEIATRELQEDELLQQAVQNQSWVSDPDTRVDQVLGEPEATIALLVYLKSKQLQLPHHLLAILDLEPEDIPDIGNYWWQVLVNAYLFKNVGWSDDERHADHRRMLARSLRDKNLLRNRELQLSDAKLVKRHMTQSSAKIQACVDIYHCEREIRGAGLRQVILTDFIRDEHIGSDAASHKDALGAWPIFRSLAQRVTEAEKSTCALLTGRLVVLHESVARGIAEVITYRRLEHLEGFVQLDSSSRNPVAILTDLLEKGAVHVLVGTRALLGEGWDAPCINSLILASSVGSYMLTNQMRGRAIRVDKNNPNKVSSIWHIVAVVLDRRLFDLGHNPRLFWPGLADFRELDSRFSTFVGLHETEATIENNLLRLQLPYVRRKHDFVSGAEHLAFREHYFQTGKNLESTNQAMIDRLSLLGELRQRWDTALAGARRGEVVPSVMPDTPPTARLFHFERTLFYFIFVAIAASVTVAWVAQMITSNIAVAFAASMIWSLPKFFLAARLFLKHLPVDGTIHQIGLAVRDTLCATGVIENSAARLKVESHSWGGDVYVNLDGGNFHEKSVFADCMEEILGPIENPRYLLVRHGTTLGIRRKDYHAVPARIGVKKEYATVLHQAWLKYVGRADLIYTRTPETRKALLSARARAFSSGTKKLIKRIDRWV